MRNARGCYGRPSWISGILDLKLSWNPLHSISQPWFSGDRHLNHLFKSNSFSVIAYFTQFYMMNVCGCYGRPSWISGTQDLKQSWNPLHSTVSLDLVGIDTLITCLSKIASQLLSISTGYRRNVVTVAVGDHLGFQVPLTSNNHSTIFIQTDSLDLVGKDTFITRLGQ